MHTHTQWCVCVCFYFSLVDRLRLEYGFGITALVLLGLEALLSFAAAVRFAQDDVFRSK